MADQGVVTEATEKYAVIGGTRYYWGRDLGQRPKAGDRIEYDWNEFGEARGRYGKPRGMTKWRPIRDASGAPQTGSTMTEVDLLRSVSNLVGSALTSGAVKSPEELAKWCIAAKLGLEQAMQAKSAPPRKTDPYADYHGPETGGSEPSFDDDIPF